MARIRFLCIILLVLNVGFIWAQNTETDTATHDVSVTINEVALLDVNLPATPVSFTINPPATAGDAPTVAGSPNTDKTLSYTSLITTADTRNITAQLDSVMPAGLTLALVVTGAIAGNGTRGTAAASINLDNTAQAIITGIGSCYTGAGAGANLQFTLSYDPGSVGSLVVGGPYTRTVTYTITN